MKKYKTCIKCNTKILPLIGVDPDTSFTNLVERAHKHFYHINCWESLSDFQKFLIIKGANKK
jgi:predicted nucleic-acid-binding Zn-ribbon protein